MIKILVVVDMQQDFLVGSLANEDAVAVIPNIKREIESGYYDSVIFTRDTHDEKYLNTQEGKKLPIPHCMVGKEGWMIADELMWAVYENDIPHQCLNKITFGSDNWREFMNKIMRIKDNDIEFTLVGTCTDICVISNAVTIKSAYPNAPIRCIADCCAASGRKPEERKQNNEETFHIMSHLQVEIVR